MKSTTQKHPLNKVSDIKENLRPLNVGDLNRTLWPFFFTFDAAEVAPDRTVNNSFTVSQEAAFIWTSYTKTVFKKVGANFIALDPQETIKADSEANGLEFTLRDAQSSRTFMDKPMAFDHVGWARNPTVLSTPMLLLPNSTMESVVANTSPDGTTYVAFLTLFGYRVRLEDMDKVLSTISG